MKLLLKREIYTPKTTISRLYVDGVFECYILEDKDRELNKDMALADIQKAKVKGATAIPEGEYKIVINQSNRFDRLLPLLINVPGFEGIRIHPGNSDADTSGCLLPGISRRKDFVGSSRVAFERLFQKMQLANKNGEKISITIK